MSRIFKIGQVWGNEKRSRILRDVRGLSVTYTTPKAFIKLGDQAPHHSVGLYVWDAWIRGTNAELIAGPDSSKG